MLARSEECARVAQVLVDLTLEPGLAIAKEIVDARFARDDEATNPQDRCAPQAIFQPAAEGREDQGHQQQRRRDLR